MNFSRSTHGSNPKCRVAVLLTVFVLPVLLLGNGCLVADDGRTLGDGAGGGDVGSCSWTGIWDTNNDGTMTLSQVGATVTGTYTFRNGTVKGTVAGNDFTGTWGQSTTSDPNCLGGDQDVVMSSDCRTFSGSWWYCSGASRHGQTPLTGTRR